MKKLIISFIALLTSFTVLAQHIGVKASISVPGRNSVGNRPSLIVYNNAEGIVVVDVWVDNYGNVTRAVPGGEGTTTMDKNLLEAARKAALETHFNMSAEAPATQEGTITYTFTSKGVSEPDGNAFTFVGIPIDGTKAQMIKALEGKGFNSKFREELTGMFNGEEVTLYISTNHGIVDRIRVRYPYYSAENDVRVKYNTLLSQFNRNAKYISINPRTEISAKESISDKRSENTKYYDAIYFYLNPETDANGWVATLKQEYQNHYHKALAALSYEEMEEALMCLPTKVSSAVCGIVWFAIVDTFPYEININYINFKNRPRGEDL